MFRWIEKWAKARNPVNKTWTTVSWMLFWRAWLPCFWYGMYRYRVWGSENIPRTGPVLLICNHQSFFDLFAIGVISDKRIFMSMARATLFNNPHFGKLLHTLNAVPIKQGGSDRKALNKMMDMLKNDACLLVFPEGSRTSDGRTADFQQGISLLIKRAKPTIIPMGLEGPYDIWKMGQKFPKLRGRSGIQIGPPIDPDELLAMGAKEGIQYLESVVETYRMNVRGRLRVESHGAFPPQGIADTPSRPLIEELLWDQVYAQEGGPAIESEVQKTDELCLGAT